MPLKLLSEEELRIQCPVKWNKDIPKGGLGLGMADVDFAGPHGIKDFIKNNLEDSYSFYQHKSGMPNALEIIQSYLGSINLESMPKNLQVIPGSMIGIYAAMKWASRRAGKIVFLGPLYEPIHRHATDSGNEIDWVSINFWENKIDEDDLLEKVDTKTKMIGINNPSNPIGYVYSKRDLTILRDLVVDHDIILFSDELYAPLTFGPSFIPAASIEGLHEKTIALYGFSKAYGLAGYRSGFMYLGDEISEEIRHIVEAQLVSPNPITSLVCEFALTSPAVAEWVKSFRINSHQVTKFAAKKFNENGYQCHQPDSCFFVYPNIGQDDAAFVQQLLAEDGIQVVEGSKFGPTGINHIRINCGTSEERLKGGIDKIVIRLDE